MRTFIIRLSIISLVIFLMSTRLVLGEEVSPATSFQPWYNQGEVVFPDVGIRLGLDIRFPTRTDAREELNRWQCTQIAPQGSDLVFRAEMLAESADPRITCEVVDERGSVLTMVAPHKAFAFRVPIARAGSYLIRFTTSQNNLRVSLCFTVEEKPAPENHKDKK